jgi:hypothetical protein
MKASLSATHCTNSFWPVRTRGILVAETSMVSSCSVDGGTTYELVPEDLCAPVQDANLWVPLWLCESDLLSGSWGSHFK